MQAAIFRSAARVARSSAVAQPMWKRTFVNTQALLEEDRKLGTIKWFDTTRGYGFIETEEGTDVFCHQTALQMPGFRSVAEGQQVEFATELSDDGRTRAVEVSAPGGEDLPPVGRY